MWVAGSNAPCQQTALAYHSSTRHMHAWVSPSSWQITQANVNAGSVFATALVTTTAANGKYLVKEGTWIEHLDRNLVVSIGDLPGAFCQYRLSFPYYGTIWTIRRHSSTQSCIDMLSVYMFEVLSVTYVNGTYIHGTCLSMSTRWRELFRGPGSPSG